MKVLVIGRSGQVARALISKADRDTRIVALGRPDVDFERPDTLVAALNAHAPDVVASVGAYTAVDQAEKEPDIAERTNAIGPGALARACAERGIPIVHLSTDYVFDGAKTGAYVEDDATNPTGVYGRTKLAGERAVAGSGARHAILRAAWVFDAEGKNFLRTMLRLAKTRERIGVVADQRGCPTYADHLADVVVEVARKLEKGEGNSGVYHVAGGSACSWRDFAVAILEGSTRRGGPSAAVEPLTTADYPTLAKRPANSVLDCGKLARDYQLSLPPWQSGMEACLAEIEIGGWRVD